MHTPVDVRPQDLDCYGVVNNSTYLSYLEVGRWALLSPRVFKGTYSMPVVARLDIHYRRAIAGHAVIDGVAVWSRVSEKTHFQFTVAQRITPAGEMYDCESLYGEATVCCAFVSDDGRPIQLRLVLPL